MDGIRAVHLEALVRMPVALGQTRVVKQRGDVRQFAVENELAAQTDGLRERRPSAAPVEQFDIHVAFDLLDEVSDRRRNSMQQFGRLGERAGPLDGIQYFKDFK